MGNTLPKNTKQQENKEDDIENMNFENVISYVAAKFITQANFKDLQKLHKPEYCNKLIVLTSKIIKKYLNQREIEYLKQKTRGGQEVNEMTKENITFFTKEDIDNIDVGSNLKKKRICLKLATFYIKIAHLFAAIATTINPSYTYTDTNGITHTISFKERSSIPKGVEIKTRYNNLCKARIEAIRPREQTENKIRLRMKNCDMNQKINSEVDGVQVPIASTETKTLDDEIGIPELETLYHDIYDLEQDNYLKMSEQAQTQYQQDLERFYKSFTGSPHYPNTHGFIIENMRDVPENDIIQLLTSNNGANVVYLKKRTNKFYVKVDNTSKRNAIIADKNILYNNYPLVISAWEIKKFSDIQLADFHNHPMCTEEKSTWKQSYSASPNDKLFKEYAEHIRKMIENSQKKEKNLLNIIKEIFSFWFDPQKQEKMLVINPDLTEDRLQELINTARDNIIDIYISCQEDFIKGIELFSAIQTSKMIETSQRRIELHEQKMSDLTNAQVVQEPVVSAGQGGGVSKHKKRRTYKKRNQRKKKHY